jgi:hypothetical protein
MLPHLKIAIVRYKIEIPHRENVMLCARFLIGIGISFFAVGCHWAFCCIVVRTTEHQQHPHV